MSDVGPVRVSRFEWERLMMMGGLPEQDRFKLLALGIFMSADGSSARPGNAGLAEFGPHEVTWKKLLQRAVKAGWLVLVARGGARRGPGGTTVRRASVYAAAVPSEVWERREEIFNAKPYRTPDSLKGALEASFKGSDSLKGASNAPLSDPDSLKGASETPFNALDASLKEASGDPLQNSMKGAPEVLKGASDGFEGSTATLPHHVVTPRTSTTPAAADATRQRGSHENGGGGGGEEQHQGPSLLVEALDYRGLRPSRTQHLKLCKLVAHALASGWTEQSLKEYLDLGTTAVRSPAAVYIHRLGENELPEPPATKAAATPKCDECDEDGLRYRDPIAETSAYRCPCRTRTDRPAPTHQGA